MPYQTIVVHVDDAPSMEARIHHAIGLARHCGAHLIGLALSGISRSLYPTLPSEKSDPTLALHMGYLREHAASGIARFSQLCEQAGLHSWAAEMVDDEVAAGLILQSRAADLTVLSQPAPDDDTSEDVPAHVVLQAGGPVLVLPFSTVAAAQRAAPRQVLAAWDASREAARALQAALPLLQAAQQVSVVTFDTHPPGQVSMDARRADPLPWLARHGVQAQLVTRTVDAPRLAQRRHPVGEALLSLVGESGADLLVMGAYAHSRVRELLLGGVTHTVFKSMTVPVLMAH